MRRIVIALAVVGASSITGVVGAQEQPARFGTLEEAVAAGVVMADLVAAVDGSAPVDAIVSLARADAEAAAAEAEAAGAPAGAVIEEYGDALDPAREAVASSVAVRTELPTLSVMAVAVGDADELLALANQPDVTGVAPDRSVTLAMAESLPLIRQPEVVQAGFTGVGTAVAVIDTGADYLRPGFGNCQLGPGSAGCRVAVAEDVAPDDGSRDSSAILHGTRVAAIVAGTAPGTTLLVYDVFSGTTASQSALATAVQRVIERKMAGFAIRAMNISVAGSMGCGQSSDFGLADAVAAGILPVISSGNGATTAGIPWPGCLTPAIAVGAVGDSSGTTTCGPFFLDQVTCFSNSGPELDVLAPGAAIAASDLGAGYGTSFAAAFVSGAIAMLAQSRPTAGTELLRDAVVNTGPVIVDPRNGLGRRRLDVAAARARLDGLGEPTWTNLGGVLVGDPDLAAWGGGRVDVFARGTDNALWHQWWDGQRWGSWESLGGQLTAAPTAVSWGPGRIDVFARGSDGGMWQLAFDGRWSSWIPQGGQLAGAPEVTSWAPGRLDVFVQGVDNHLYQKFWNGSSWSGWVGLGGTLTAGPTAASWAPGRIDVFAQGAGNQLWHLFHAGGWSNWEPLGGTFVGDPDASSFAAGRLDVFVLGTDSQVWQKVYDGTWRLWRLVDEEQVGSAAGSVDHGRGTIDLVVRAQNGNALYRFGDGATW